jgi:hypothetical protein
MNARRLEVNQILVAFLAREFAGVEHLDEGLTRSRILDYVKSKCEAFEGIKEEEQNRVLQNAIDTAFPGLLRSHQKTKKRNTVRLALRFKPKPFTSLAVLAERAIFQAFPRFLRDNLHRCRVTSPALWDYLLEKAIGTKLVTLAELEEWEILSWGRQETVTQALQQPEDVKQNISSSLVAYLETPVDETEETTNKAQLLDNLRVFAGTKNIKCLPRDNPRSDRVRKLTSNYLMPMLAQVYGSDEAFLRAYGETETGNQLLTTYIAKEKESMEFQLKQAHQEGQKTVLDAIGAHYKRIAPMLLYGLSLSLEKYDRLRNMLSYKTSTQAEEECQTKALKRQELPSVVRDEKDLHDKVIAKVRSHGGGKNIGRGKKVNWAELLESIGTTLSSEILKQWTQKRQNGTFAKSIYLSQLTVTDELVAELDLMVDDHETFDWDSACSKLLEKRLVPPLEDLAYLVEEAYIQHSGLRRKARRSRLRVADNMLMPVLPPSAEVRDDMVEPNILRDTNQEPFLSDEEILERLKNPNLIYMLVER